MEMSIKHYLWRAIVFQDVYNKNTNCTFHRDVFLQLSFFGQHRIWEKSHLRYTAFLWWIEEHARRETCACSTVMRHRATPSADKRRFRAIDDMVRYIGVPPALYPRARSKNRVEHARDLDLREINKHADAHEPHRTSRAVFLNNVCISKRKKRDRR